MLFHKLLSLLGMALSVALFSVGNCQAVEIAIDAGQDTYIRSNSAANKAINFNNQDLISGGSYISLVQFDLSGVAGNNITSAYIKGYLIQDSDSDYLTSGGYAHELFLARTDPNDPTFDGGMNETTMTYNIYAGPWNADEKLMEGLGKYSEVDIGDPNSYKDFQSATAADLVELNARAQLSNPAQRFALFYVSCTDPYRWWEDHESDHPMQLVLNVVPNTLPGDFNQDTFVDAADYVVWRKNPVSFAADAYDTWRANFGAPFGSGAGLGTAAVPEPATGGLLAVVLAALVGSATRGKRRWTR